MIEIKTVSYRLEIRTQLGEQDRLNIGLVQLCRMPCGGRPADSFAGISCIDEHCCNVESKPEF